MFAAIGMLYARRVNAPLDYRGALRVTVFAATPAIVVSGVREALGVSSTLGLVFDFLIVLGYVHFAVRANARPRSGGELSLSA
jgi:hypothetical protein